ncbi:MAG TPA: 3-oxoadipate enol-lactonase [Solirubrobacteraceae bacterium]|nr:3-oxoadipate enol-lactonase [Solirubrobacteraceae bacterium]
MSAAAVKLHHAVDGPAGGRVLLLGGSLGTTLAMWEPQVAALSAVVRVVRFDHRGHGGSPVPAGPYAIDDLGRDVLALMDDLGLQRACYCGLSLGGMVGQWLAISAPERIERVILMCTGAYLPPPQQWLERAEAVRAAGSPEVLADAVVARWFTKPFAAANPDVVARHRAMVAATDPGGYAACCEAIAAMDLRQGLPSVRVPALVVSGAQDPSIPAEHGRAIARSIPGARFELLDPAAHVASVERADAVNELVAGFVGVRG